MPGTLCVSPSPYDQELKVHFGGTAVLLRTSRYLMILSYLLAERLIYIQEELAPLPKPYLLCLKTLTVWI